MILMKTRLYKALEDLKLAAVILFLLVFVVCNSKCDSDEIVVYHKKPVIEAVYKEKASIEVSSKPDLEPVIEPVIKKEIPNKFRLIKNCEPRCDRNESCNSETGRCEGIANKLRPDTKWTPKQEHSAVFYVDSNKSGTYSPGDDYLMINR